MLPLALPCQASLAPLPFGDSSSDSSRSGYSSSDSSDGETFFDDYYFCGSSLASRMNDWLRVVGLAIDLRSFWLRLRAGGFGAGRC